MKKLNLRTKMKNNFIEVPVEFIDTFMPSYNATTLKCYLYLLRASIDHSILLSMNDLADLFDVTPNKIMLSLKALEKDHLVSLEFDDNEITDICLLDFHEATMPSSGILSEEEEPVSYTPVKETTPSVAFTPSRETSSVSASYANRPIDFTELANDNNFSDLLALAEYLTKKNLSQMDYQTLGYCYYLYDKNTDIIEQLILYCVKEGHTSFHYMKKVCESWKSNNLLTAKQIEEFTSVHNKKISVVLKAYGIKGRNLIDSEVQYVERWFQDFSEELITYACTRTIHAIGSVSFSYTDKMLAAWKEENVKTIADVDLLDQQYARNKKSDKDLKNKVTSSINDYKQRNVDINKIAANFYE